MDLTPLDLVRVVILGQDPYPTPGYAHGLAFSVHPGVKVPRSLHNIFTELEDDLGVPRPDHGCLTHWAEQGVLLLNTALTVRERAAAPGQGVGEVHRRGLLVRSGREAVDWHIPNL